MQFLTLMLSILLLTIATPLVSAGPVIVDRIPEGYKLGKMGFNGEIAGHQISYNGSIEEILAYAETLHPGITKALAARDDVPLLDTTALTSPNVASRSAADWYYGGPQDGKGHRDCGTFEDCRLCPEWGYCQNRYIEDGIKYLNKVSGTCNTDGHTCVRISCSWHAGIHLCNDMDQHVELPCNWVSTFAADIIHDDKCQDPLNYRWDHPESNGQQWAGNKAYNVYTGWQSC